MTCSYCGSWQPYDPTARFCTSCGGHFAAVDETVALRGGQAHPAQYPTEVVPARPGRAERDWRRHPATWSVAAALVLVAGMVLAAVILSSGGDGEPAAQSTPGTSASPVAGTSTSRAASVAAPAAPGATTTVKAAPGITRTRTVVVDPPRYDGPRVPGSLSGEFATSEQIDASPYLAYGTAYFTSPSGNIACYVYEDSADCTIAKYDFDEPGYDCPLGAEVTLDYSGASIDCSSERVTPGGRVLAYGRSIVNGSVACVSKSAGVSCALVSSGTGFSLSREQVAARY